MMRSGPATARPPPRSLRMVLPSSPTSLMVATACDQGLVEPEPFLSTMMHRSAGMTNADLLRRRVDAVSETHSSGPRTEWRNAP